MWVSGSWTLSSAASADAPDYTIEPRIVLLDPLSQGVLLGVDLAGVNITVPPCRRIGLPITLVDPLKVFLGWLQVIPGWLPMSD